MVDSLFRLLELQGLDTRGTNPITLRSIKTFFDGDKKFDDVELTYGDMFFFLTDRGRIVRDHIIFGNLYRGMQRFPAETETQRGIKSFVLQFLDYMKEELFIRGYQERDEFVKSFLHSFPRLMGEDLEYSDRLIGFYMTLVDPIISIAREIERDPEYQRRSRNSEIEDIGHSFTSRTNSIFQYTRPKPKVRLTSPKTILVVDDVSSLIYSSLFGDLGFSSFYPIGDDSMDIPQEYKPRFKMGYSSGEDMLDALSLYDKYGVPYPDYILIDIELGKGVINGLDLALSIDRRKRRNGYTEPEIIIFSYYTERYKQELEKMLAEGKIRLYYGKDDFSHRRMTEDLGLELVPK